MKKAITLLIALVIILNFAACGANIEHTASFPLYIEHSASGENADVTVSEQEDAQQAAATYEYIMKTDDVLNAVIEEANLSLTTDQLKEMLSLVCVDETQIFEVSVTADESQLALNIAEALSEILPSAICRIVSGLSVRLIDSPKLVK